MNRNYFTISNLEPWLFLEFKLSFDDIRLNHGLYQSNYFFLLFIMKIILAKIILIKIKMRKKINIILVKIKMKNITQNTNEKILVKIKTSKIPLKIEFQNSNQEKEDQSNLVSNPQK
ncbi:hypothetical protein B296_00007789 [Ensete ventricosum]|uniref:Transmembrane protein n=1 Tax=Ensete ventricosum TaxID=4639 RepID=A0A427BB37_ENSVE|nr:hypothetical protein B296_00007789 [Ensete ventricosum]